MQDNELLFTSANCWNESGELRLDKKSLTDFEVINFRTCSCRDEKTKQKYFVKHCSPEERTAEVLLSQIYAKHGFITAIALPADKNRIITNDIIEKQKGELAYDFFVRKALQEKDRFSPKAIKKILDGSCDVVDLKSASIPRWEELFTKQALASRFRWNAFAIASANGDDHLGNAVVYKNQHDIAEDIGHYDYGYAGANVRKFSTMEYLAFYDDLLEIDRISFLTSLAQNEQITKYINPKEVAEELGKVDVLDTATDITQTIGFTPRQSVVDGLARSFEQTAEDLLNLSK